MSRVSRAIPFVVVPAVFLAGLVSLPRMETARADEASEALARYAARADASIEKGLAFLEKNQQENGSFRCPQMPGNAGVTSLCLMAFLAQGSTPGAGPYGERINRGIDYILSLQRQNGLIVAERGRSHGPMYSHGISTLLLSEVSGMVTTERQERIDVVLPKALRLILSAQKRPKGGHHRGGWRYQPNSNDSDISCSGWALLSLRSARNGGAEIPREAIDLGVKYVQGLRCPDGGFGYSGPNNPGLARTGTALLCLELCGQHGHEMTTSAGDWILGHLPKRVGGGHFYYGLYYCSQGMFQLGGKYWEQWARHMYEIVPASQKPDGSWPQASGTAGRGGTCYTTAMCVLAMSVPYRQLPIYQR